MNFKVGDRVRVRSWESLEKEFGLTKEGDIDCESARAHFTSDMGQYCGTIHKITEIHSNYCFLKGCYCGFAYNLLEPLKTEAEERILQEKSRGEMEAKARTEAIVDGLYSNFGRLKCVFIKSATWDYSNKHTSFSHFEKGDTCVVDIYNNILNNSIEYSILAEHVCIGVSKKELGKYLDVYREDKGQNIPWDTYHQKGVN